jgi:hypothetical protein
MRLHHTSTAGSTMGDERRKDKHMHVHPGPTQQDRTRHDANSSTYLHLSSLLFCIPPSRTSNVIPQHPSPTSTPPTACS